MGRAVRLDTWPPGRLAAAPPRPLLTEASSIGGRGQILEKGGQQGARRESGPPGRACGLGDGRPGEPEAGGQEAVGCLGEGASSLC